MSEGKQTLASQCVQRLTQEILDGEVLPGEKLLSEALKERYQVGMSPVREALSKLSATGLVAFEEHKGYSVAKLTADEMRDNILTFAEIECLALKASITHGDFAWEGEVVAAEHLLKKVESQKKVQFLLWAPQNRRFHNALVSACPLHALIEIRNRLYERHQWYILLSYKFAGVHTIAANHKEHEQIAKAALSRNHEKCCRLMYEHIASGVDDLLKTLQTRGLIYE